MDSPSWVEASTHLPFHHLYQKVCNCSSEHPGFTDTAWHPRFAATILIFNLLCLQILKQQHGFPDTPIDTRHFFYDNKLVRTILSAARLRTFVSLATHIASTLATTEPRLSELLAIQQRCRPLYVHNVHFRRFFFFVLLRFLFISLHGSMLHGLLA
jgi:hypothetical protein